MFVKSWFTVRSLVEGIRGSVFMQLRLTFVFALFVFLISLTLNLYSLKGVDNVIPFGDTEDYLQSAQMLKKFTLESSYRAPIYPLFLLLAETVFGHLNGIMWIQAIVGSLAAVCLYRMALKFLHILILRG